MKTIGLLGGMSWESTLTYYQLINQHVRTQKQGLHSCPLILYSFDFSPIASLQHAGKWEEARLLLHDAATRLQSAGAECIVLCTNTMHFVSDGISAAAGGLPFLHIVDATGGQIVKEGFKKVGLLGTRFTMEEAFYKERLREGFGVEVLVPGEEGREKVHGVIYGELVRGVVRGESREVYRGVIEELKGRGAECLVLGCTEIGMLVGEGECGLRVFDTTRIHAVAAAEWAMANDERVVED